MRSFVLLCLVIYKTVCVSTVFPTMSSLFCQQSELGPDESVSQMNFVDTEEADIYKKSYTSILKPSKYPTSNQHTSFSTFLVVTADNVVEARGFLKVCKT
jgi:hypothetical protein